jgi:hypothetical protein
MRSRQETISQTNMDDDSWSKLFRGAILDVANGRLAPLRNDGQRFESRQIISNSFVIFRNSYNLRGCGSYAVLVNESEGGRAADAARRRDE